MSAGDRPTPGPIWFALCLLLFFSVACDDAPSRPVDDSDAAGRQNHTTADDAGACEDGCAANNFTFPAYSGIEVRPEGFVVDGRPRTLRGGTLQWFRLPSGEWHDRLRKFAAAGFNTVDVYVPWNVVEPEPGRFEFADLLAFLSACRAHGLYVYFRPGPYICNEMNGGGLPAWLVTSSTKKSLAADGLVNFRTSDPDYLDRVRAYFEALNEAILPHLVTRGGPIILYSVENEYNWFEIFAGVDKLAWHEGGTERPVGQDVGTTAYLSALRDMLLEQGVDVPITTCPGDSKISGMGEVSGIIPMPNMYLSGGTEKLAYDVVTGMHDPSRYDGRFTGMPSGTTESERKAVRMIRTLFGGMDAYFAFNIAGMHTPDRHNAVVLNNAGLQSMVDATPERVLQAFVSPTVGYFHNVIDYYGAIGPAGSVREKFFHFRRANAFFDAFDEWIAPLLHPLRSGGFDGADPAVVVTAPGVGAQEDGDRVHYWFRAADGAWFLQLLNEGQTDLMLPPDSITVDGVSFPRHSTMTLPTEYYPGGAVAGSREMNAVDSPEELDHAHIAVGNLPLLPDLKLSYTTAGVLTWRTFNGEPLLVLYAPEGATGELALAGSLIAPEPVHADDGVLTHAGETGAGLVLTWTAGAPRVVRLRAASGETLRLWLLTTRDAGRLWFFRAAFQDLALTPLRDLEILNDDATRLRTRASLDPGAARVVLFSDTPVQLNWGYGDPAFDPDRGLTVFEAPPPDAAPALPDLNATGRVRPEPGPGDDWLALGTSAAPLETVGILSGPAWVRASVTLPDPVPNNGQLTIDHAADIVGITVNGQYVTTVCPVGTEIDNQAWNASYRFADLRPYLVPGVNEVLFRVEVWGHGSFMWPRGRIIATNAQIPSLGYDAFKGLWGAARLAGRDLVNWQAQALTTGEVDRWFAPDADEADFTPKALPMTLTRGEQVWYRASFATADVLPRTRWRAPLALRLAGRNLKATIWLNGRLIGRWLSDEDFLQRGAWTRALRSMWMNTSPDEFPLADSLLASDGSDNVVAILLEDVSSSDDATGGLLFSADLIHFPEEKGRDAQDVTIPAVAWRIVHSLVFSPF
jgi:hypothetical protein